MIIRMFDENRDIDDFLQLFKISFGKPMSKEYFEWKYIKNPFKINIHPIIVAEESGRLIGARPMQFSRMMVKGDIVYATHGTDAMVHPNFRRQGINLELRKFTQELYRESEYKLRYGFPNKMSFGNILRTGAKLIYKHTTHWKVLNSQEVFKTAFNKSILRKVGYFLSPLLWYQTRVPQLRNQNVTLKPVDDVKILEDIYDRWKKPDRIYTVRDETYLNWRFISHPEIAYKFLAAYVGEEVKGYFVISITESMGMKRGTIVDYIAVDDDPDIFEPLLNYSLNIFKDSNCSLADTWVYTQKWAQQVVKDYGFLSSRNILLRHWSFNAYLTAQPWNEKSLSYDLTDREWYVTPSDSDTN